MTFTSGVLLDVLPTIGRYLRVSPAGLDRESTPSSSLASTLFVDVDSPIELFDETIAGIRKMDPAGLVGLSHLVARIPESGVEDRSSALTSLSQLVRRLPTSCSVGIVVGACGEQVEIEWSDDAPPPTEEDLAIVQKCRTVELASLLANGGAIWEPQNYHYRLPSGRHSSTFIRFADSIRSVRDAECIAWWLYPEIVDGLEIVLDSPSLIPVALAVQNLAAASSLEVDAHVLPPYPVTTVAFSRYLKNSTSRASKVLALLSVSSSGSMQDRLHAALAQLRVESRLQVFVDKTARTDSPDEDVWLGLASGLEAAADSCEMCKSPERSRIVHIDPKSFGGIVLPQPDLLTPEIRYGGRTKQFWELCDRADALSLEAEPHASSLAARPQNSRMSIRVDFESILFDEAESEALVRLATSKWAAVEGDFSVAVVDGGEAAMGGGLGLACLVRMAAELEIDTVVELDQGGAFSVTEPIAQADRVAVLALGAVSGTKLQRLLAATTDLRRSENLSNPDVHAFVVHLRPSSDRARETIVKSFFEANFHAAFESVLPLDRRPLLDEHNQIRLVRTDELTETAANFHTERLSFQAGPGSGFSILWGMGDDPESDANRLRPGSLYGDNLRALSAFVAIGSAVQKARSTSAALSSPAWQQFELPAVLNLYFDPLLVCSILRWLDPAECWWGRDSVDAEPVIHRFLETYEHAHEQRIIASELLLASAQGKIPLSAHGRIVDFARELIDRGEDTFGSIELGLALHDPAG